MEKYEIWARKDKGIALTPEILLGMKSNQIVAASMMWSAYKIKHPPAQTPANHSWSWRRKAPTALQHSFIGLRYAKRVQGMMMVEIYPRACRAKGSEHKALLYIEYLETAPWNQKPYAGANTQYLGVGRCLIDIAIRLSVEYNCEGRLGLHSLEDAKGFYVDQGFENLGQDPEENLDYFELSDSALGNTEL